MSEQRPGFHGETPIDVEYVNRLKKSYEVDKGFTHELDWWIIAELDHLFRPLCVEMSERVNQLSIEQVAYLCNRFPNSPKEFPLVRFPKEDERGRSAVYGAMALYVEKYDPSQSKEDHLKKLQEAKDAATDEIHRLNEGPSSHDKRVQLRVQGKKEDAAEIALAQYKRFSRKLDSHIPTDATDRKEFIAMLESAQNASPLKKDFEVSKKAPTAVVMTATAISTGFADEILSSAYYLPVWTKDKTIPEDLLYALNIMAHQSVHLKDTAQALSDKAPLFASRETARGYEARLGNAMIGALNEGTLSIGQSLNKALGQVVREHKEATAGKSEVEIMRELVDANIPVEEARYLPPGYVGPSNAYGHYMKGLVEPAGNSWRIKPEHRETAKNIKKNIRDGRWGSMPYLTFDIYAVHHLFGTPLSLNSGAVCPVSREEKGNTSGIELLDHALFDTFLKVREARSRGLIS